MLKVRVQGTKSDIRWFREKLEQHPQIAVMQVSDMFSNKGTTKYFRMYAEIEEKKGGMVTGITAYKRRPLT